MCLSHFVKLPKLARVLDLGSGCGTLGLLLCSLDKTCSVTGLELSEECHREALDNIRRNTLDHRMESICEDLRSLSLAEKAGTFHCCVSNPPYFSGGPLSKNHPTARREDQCAPQELFDAAARFLKFGGDFFLVHKPEKLAQLIGCGAKVNLEAKRLLLIRHREGAPISLILLSFRKGGKPGLTIEEATLFDQNGEPTDFYKSVYHINP
jgi:tRNA1(Val) A37 N6-methylase TrmN6